MERGRNGWEWLGGNGLFGGLGMAAGNGGDEVGMFLC